ncbi:MAG: class B sortase [Lachnospiraceae bacterium]|nr:class B sortase [Lachnospiraceae bacterium]
MRRNRMLPTGVLIVLVVIAAALCITLGVLMYMDKKGAAGEEAREEPVQTEDISGEDGEDGSLIPKDKEINVKELKDSVNKDICAWLYIPDTGIDTPVLRSEEDLMFYSDHNEKGEADENGAIYMQMINSADFSDNLTVLYGHNSEAGSGFSALGSFGDPEFFDSHPYIYIYTPEEVLVYEVFAAYESDDKLLVIFYGTSNDDQYSVYLSRIEDQIGLGGNLRKEALPDPGYKTLTLSTGIKGRDDRRFLVQGRLYGAFALP